MSRPHFFRNFLLLAIWGLSITGYCPDGLANGNYTHIWAATDALNYLPDGDLQKLISRPELLQMLQNGAMYPDGGYAADDDYGETSHWEPFQSFYLEWIKANFEPPWSDEAAGHIAFLMGMAAHGMSDQLYDGMYLERYEAFEGRVGVSAFGGIDGITDTCFAAAHGVMTPPENWVPAQALAPLYEAFDGHHVEPATIELGQSLVVVAVMYANDRSQDPETMAEYMSSYPWTCGNQNNDQIPGSPPTHGPVIARYWEVLWERLNGASSFDQPLLGTFYSGMTPYDQVTDSGSPESWVAFVMPWGLDPTTVNDESVIVSDDAGQPVPVTINVYYGWNSHLVNLKPKQDWDSNTEYTVTIGPPMASWNGVPVTRSHQFPFATFSQPTVLESVETGDDDVVSQDVAVEILESDLSSDVVSKEPQSGCTMGTTGSADGSLIPFLLLLLALGVPGVSRRSRQWMDEPSRN